MKLPNGISNSPMISHWHTYGKHEQYKPFYSTERMQLDDFPGEKLDTFIVKTSFPTISFHLNGARNISYESIKIKPLTISA